MFVLCLSSSSNRRPSLNLRVYPSWEFVGITVLFLDEKIPSTVRRANHYMPSLKADFIVKVDRFEVARLFDNLQVIVNTNLELSDVVGQIRSVQGSDLTTETTRVVICLLID
uniref:Uncharacterized protein n=1 Tax=Brassica oleracea var. oleracea TaxID=109376 RepID=A0A0D3B356_BRAOL